MSEKNKALILMCLVVFIWGMDYIVAKATLDTLPLMNLLFFKYVIALVMILIIMLCRKTRPVVHAKDIIFFVICAFAGEVCYYLCEYTAMSYIPVSMITVILAFVPVLSILIERVLFKKRLKASIIIAVIICVLGVAIVIGADFRNLAGGSMLGYLLAFGAVVSWNIYNFMTAHLSDSYDSIAITFNQLMGAMIISAPFAIYSMPPASTFTLPIIGGLLYLGIGCTAVGFLIMVKGLKELGPTVTAMFSNFLPVTTTLFGWLFLKEMVGPVQIIGGIIVIVSSCVVIREKGKMEAIADGRET